jgi:hypothetical protein
MKGWRTLTAMALLTAGVTASPAPAGFTNGDFETGDLTGWTRSGGTYFTAPNYNVTPGDLGRSAVVGAGYDPELQSRGVLFNRVYGGNYSARIEDSGTGAHWSSITQTAVWTDPNIFFAYAAVLQEPGHPHDQEPHFRVTLKDLTAGTTLYDVQYASDTIPANLLHTVGDVKYTDWQVVNLDTSTVQGHSLQLTVLGADCGQSGHWGYAYVDGFSAQLPQSNAVPAPPTALMLAFGLPALALRRLRRKVAPA